MLINVGGLTHHPMPWDEQTGDMLVEKFRVMAVGPLLTIKHFLPKLERAPGAKVVNISSGYGSISSTSLCHDSLQGMATRADTWVLRVDKSMGTCMAYRVAKAALNQGAVTMAREWEKEGRNVTMICVQPGYVPTRLTRWGWGRGHGHLHCRADGALQEYHPGGQRRILPVGWEQASLLVKL